MSLLLSMFLFIFIYVNQWKKTMNDNLLYIENLYTEHAISLEKNKIKSAFDVLLNNSRNINNMVKSKLKRRVNMAYDIVINIYKNNGNLRKKEVVKLIKDAIEPIRFDNGEGYFFIYNTNGVNILLPPDRSIEGKNMLKTQDAKGRYIIKDAINLVRSKGAGFLTWYWYKPVNSRITKKSEIYEKIGYVRYIKPLHWFIGTGIYIKSELKRMENRFLKAYEKKKNRLGEYFIVLRPINGKIKILANSNRPYLSNTVVSEHFKDINAHSYLPEILRFLREGKNEGVIRYKYAMPQGYDKEVIVYVFYKKLDMLVLYGLDLNGIENIVRKAQKRYKAKMYGYVKNVILLSVAIILVVGILFLFIAYNVNNIFFRYKKEVEENRKSLEKLALYDNLTDVYNRNKFNEILQYEINMSKRYKTPLSLIMFDLDRFKRVNDKYGHTVGDKLLKMIAKTVQNSIRATDTLARWGGEEFFIILPKTDTDKAVKIAEGLRAKIESMDFKGIGKITCSFGVASLKENESIDDLIKRTDEAMYKAKRNGRNRVEVL